MNGGFSQSARVLSAVASAAAPQFGNPFAHIALEEFTRRRDALRRAVRGQGFDLARANRQAELWLAIALAAGARPPEAAGLDGSEDIALPAQWQAELARAAVAATARRRAAPDDRAGARRALGLAALARLLCPAGGAVPCTDK